jgi:type II secretory pathway pseudopilin PulG
VSRPRRDERGRAPCAPGAAAGFSLFELLFAIALIGSIAFVFLERLAYYQEWAEKTAMERAARDMQSAVRLRVGELVIRGRSGDIAALDGANPMALLDPPLSNYAGERRRGAELPRGAWYFDTADRVIAYLPKLSTRFRAEGAHGRVAYRVRVIWEPPRQGFQPQAQWARLEPVEGYRWFN